MGSGKEVKLKKKKAKGGPPAAQPVPTAAEKQALRKQRLLLKKQAGVEANAACKKYMKKLKVCASCANHGGRLGR